MVGSNDNFSHVNDPPTIVSSVDSALPVVSLDQIASKTTGKKRRIEETLDQVAHTVNDVLGDTENEAVKTLAETIATMTEVMKLLVAEVTQLRTQADKQPPRENRRPQAKKANPFVQSEAQSIGHPKDTSQAAEVGGPVLARTRATPKTRSYSDAVRLIGRKSDTFHVMDVEIPATDPLGRYLTRISPGTNSCDGFAPCAWEIPSNVNASPAAIKPKVTNVAILAMQIGLFSTIIDSLSFISSSS